MMKKIKLENITLDLSNEGGNVRVKSNDDNVILVNQTIEDTANVALHNFDVVNNFYIARVANQTAERFDLTDINRVSAIIILHYLYMYNFWRNTYKNKANQELMFNEKDFSNPSTSDIIMSFYRKKYPNEWEQKCSVLLGMTIDELRHYYSDREKFYNK